jgi:hypothetical protein
MKIIKKNKHPHNFWVNNLVDEYCTRMSTFGECDCFLLDFNIIKWFNEFYFWINTNINKNESVNKKKQKIKQQKIIKLLFSL